MTIPCNFPITLMLIIKAATRTAEVTELQVCEFLLSTNSCKWGKHNYKLLDDTKTIWN